MANKHNITTFKKFIERVLACENWDEAVANVFYGSDGIDMAFQRDKISWDEHEMLLGIIDKMKR